MSELDVSSGFWELVTDIERSYLDIVTLLDHFIEPEILRYRSKEVIAVTVLTEQLRAEEEGQEFNVIQRIHDILGSGEDVFVDLSQPEAAGATWIE